MGSAKNLKPGVLRSSVNDRAVGKPRDAPKFFFFQIVANWNPMGSKRSEFMSSCFVNASLSMTLLL
jgi:hypothetical protein